MNIRIDIPNFHGKLYGCGVDFRVRFLPSRMKIASRGAMLLSTPFLNAIPAAAMRRFWTMLAHYHGQTFNASQLGRSMGLSDKTIGSYFDILSCTFMVRQLQPWYENIAKRQVKAPKIYLCF